MPLVSTSQITTQKRVESWRMIRKKLPICLPFSKMICSSGKLELESLFDGCEELKDKKIHNIFLSIFTELHDIIKGVSLVKECSPRTLDIIVSFGERLCAQLMTVLFTRKEYNAEYERNLKREKKEI